MLYNTGAGRPSSHLDVAPVAAVLSTATQNRNAIRAALHALGFTDDESRTAMTAIVSGAIPFTTYTGA